MAKWLIGIFIIAWFINQPALLYFFPYSTVNEYYRFITNWSIVCEVMFLLLIGVIYMETNGLLKALATFVMILVLASVIDKAVFRITTYLYSDIILVFVALIVSWVVWKKHG